MTGVIPNSGPTAGGTSVTISGTNLSAATSVSFGSSFGAITADSATSITATAPPGGAGTVDLTVTTAGGISATALADRFTYVAPPTVTAINPTAGSIAGGTSVVYHWYEPRVRLRRQVRPDRRHHHGELGHLGHGDRPSCNGRHR